MQQDNYGGTNYQVQTGKDNTNIFGGNHYYPNEPRPSGIPDNLPYSGATTFVGREAELAELHQQLQREAAVAISAVSGMGGIGKTELALQYALQHRAEYPGGICWLRARQEVPLQLVEFARSHLDLSPPDDLELVAKVGWCWQHWNQGKTLVVLDDVSEYAQIEPVLPPQKSQFKVLLTT